MKRYWEIDVLRALAIICMAVFHTVFILVMLGMAETDLSTGFWWVFPRGIAASFITLAGISVTLTFNRTPAADNRRLKKIMTHGAIILGLGLCVTVVSLFAVKDRFVIFGILHMIGLSVILAYPLARFGVVNLLLAAAVIAGGIFLGQYRFDFYWLSWLGFRPDGYFPVDYLPLFPWFGFMLFGLFLGNLFYPAGKARIALPAWGELKAVRFLGFLGRHSLVIYLAHLPVIFGILSLVKLITGGF
jgi:uncharacterized membrane protein